MEITKIEVVILEKDEVKSEVNELSDLQLALIGGGIGDPIWA